MRLSSRPPLERLAVIDREVRAGSRPNASTLARSLEVHRRTVQRDLTFLRDRLHAPLLFDRSKNGYYYTDPSFRFSLFQLTEGELIALFLAERLLQQYRGTPYAAALASVFRKMTAALVDPITIDLGHLADVYSFRQQAVDAGDIDRFARLCRAVQNGRRLELLYWTASRDDTSRRLVDPYHLASIDGDWFLIAYCHLREDIRMFSPARIRDLKETGDSFDRPADFRITEYLDAAFRKVRGPGPPQTVRLRFTPEAARYVRERTWHSTQKLVDGKDGSMEMTFQVNHLLGVKRWVLSWGARCEILQPAELREEIQKELRTMLNLHRDQAKVDSG